MQGFNFTERVRRVLAQARDEAAALGHPYVGAEHQLLALLSDDGVASTVLQNLGLDLPFAASAIRQRLAPGTVDLAGLKDRQLPYTPWAKKVLEYAMKAATDLNHSYVGTEHLLLGLLLEGNGIAVEVLNSFGITLEDARAETRRILGVELSTLPPVGEEPVRVSLLLHYSNGAMVPKQFSDRAAAARFLTSADA